MKKQIKQKLNCDVKITSIEYWKGSDIVIPKNSTYDLFIDYPFSICKIFKLKTIKPLGFIGLLKFIDKCYKKSYKMAEANDEDGYWHGIEDLVIEGINVNHKTKKIELMIGS